MGDKGRSSLSNTGSAGLIGRKREMARIRSLWQASQQGRGGLLLVSGETGVGKTSLVRAALDAPGQVTLWARAKQGASPPYGPLLGVFRQYLRRNPEGFSSLGRLLPYLARLLPELGEAQEGDQPTQMEALLSAFDAMADGGIRGAVLDDLQWSDSATLAAFPHIAARLQDRSVLLIGIYRADEIPRDHTMRYSRAELRRAHLHEEIALEPLDEEQTAKLAQRILGEPPGPGLTRLLFERTLGVPMFVEELCRSLARGAGVDSTNQGLELVEGHEIPIPETVRDAVLMRVTDLSVEARDLLEVAAVAGQEFDPQLVEGLTDHGGALEELLRRRVLIEKEPGRMTFDRSLTRDAVYGEIAWSRRRELHRVMARRLQEEEAALRVVAEHHLAGRELDAARETLIAAAERSCELYAHRDAIEAVEKALEIWPEGEDEQLRLKALDILASSAELSGMPQRAARAWQEIAAAWKARGDLKQFAEVYRKLAKLYEIQGAWEQAQATRLEAAEAFAASDRAGEAAAERLTVASHLESTASFDAALALTTVLLDEADAVGRYDLMARGLGLKGALLAKTGQVEAGRAATQQGLSLALERDATGAAAEVYQRLASVGVQASDYQDALDAYQDAVHYCEQHDEPTAGNFCLACLSVVLRYTGDWDQAEEVCHQVLTAEETADTGRAVASAVLGLIEAARGRSESARRLLSEAAAISRFYKAFSIEVTVAWGLAIAHEWEGKSELVRTQCEMMLVRWRDTEERHYAISPLRWAATWFARQEQDAGARACADALSQIAAGGKPEALAGLAHALGEIGLMEQHAEYAIEQFGRALNLLTELSLPYEQAETRLRLAAALIAAEQREAGIEHLVRAHRAARELGARNLTEAIGGALRSIGESVDEHLGKRAAQRLEHAGLTQRQMEVLELVAEGMTNREVADELVLSPRTIDMHVSNILQRLDARSRTEAVKRAAELGLLGGS